MSNAIEWIMSNPVLRWFVFLPTAIISASAGSIIFEFVNKQALGRYMEVDGFRYNLINYPMSGMVFSFIFLYVGVFMAPTKKKSVSLFLLILNILLPLPVIFGNLFMFSEKDNWLIVYNIFSIIGSYFTYLYLKEQNYLR